VKSFNNLHAASAIWSAESGMGGGFVEVNRTTFPWASCLWFFFDNQLSNFSQSPLISMQRRCKIIRPRSTFQRIPPQSMRSPTRCPAGILGPHQTIHAALERFDGHRFHRARTLVIQPGEVKNEFRTLLKDPKDFFVGVHGGSIQDITDDEDKVRERSRYRPGGGTLLRQRLWAVFDEVD